MFSFLLRMKDSTPTFVMGVNDEHFEKNASRRPMRVVLRIVLLLFFGFFSTILPLKMSLSVLFIVLPIHKIF